MAAEKVKLEFTRNLTQFHLLVLTDYDNMRDYIETAEMCDSAKNSIGWYTQVVNLYSNISKHYNSLLFKLDIATRQELITAEEYEEYRKILKRSFDIIDVMEACVDGTLDRITLEFEDNAAVCVVLASEGYPVAYEKGFPISGLDQFDNEEYFCFHAGTAKNDKGEIVTNGGRVLGITAKGADLKTASAKAYEATNRVSFKGAYKRNDIGKAIDEV